ncbi:MAG: calcium-binding protein [Actinomycetota bacterium]
MRKILWGTAVAVAGAWVLASAGPAAAATCTFNPDNQRVLLSLAAEASTISVGGGGEILVDGVPCETATTAETDLIRVFGVAGSDEQLTVDLSGGPFEPGPTPESGIPEVEIRVTFESDPGDLVGVQGASSGEVIAIFPGGFDLNDDGDQDLTTTGVPSFVVHGGGGPDRLLVERGVATPSLELHGQAGKDVVRGGDGDDVLLGGPGDDEVRGGLGADLLLGGPDDDVLSGGGGEDELRGEEGDDVLRGGPRDDQLFGGEGHDVLGGGGGDDQLFGGPDNDVLSGEAGADLMDGGDGTDRASFVGAPKPVKADLRDGSASGWGGDSLVAVENVTGSAHNDRLTGDAGPNRLAGLGGDDVLMGLGGPDRLLGGKAKDFIVPGPGKDVVRGGPGGNDLVTLRSADGPVKIDLSKGTTSGQGKDDLRGIERAVGSHFDDVITGSAAANTRLVGARGDDIIYGLGGDDRLRGGPGKDTLLGGAGDDHLAGGSGADVLKGQGGNDDLIGGPGIDTCFQGPGTGVKASCEKP